MAKLYEKWNLKSLIGTFLILTICGLIFTIIPIAVFGEAFTNRDEVHMFVAYSFFVTICILYITFIVSTNKYLERSFIKYINFYGFKKGSFKGWYILKLILLVIMSFVSLVLMCIDWQSLYTNIVLISLSGMLMLMFIGDTIQFSIMYDLIKIKSVKPIYLF